MNNETKYNSITSIPPAVASSVGLGGRQITRKEAMDGLGEESNWDKESRAVYDEFRAKPPCRHDFTNAVRVSRANFRCAKCSADISLALFLLWEADNLPPNDPKQALGK